MKKMFAILASPRKNGNAAKMLEIAVQKAKECNYDVSYIDLYQKNIAYCKGCVACRKTSSCVINDDIKEIEELIKNCDLVVVSCPVYFANMTAPLKNMFDRLAGVIMNDSDSMIPKPKLSSKQGYILMTTCNTPFPFNILGGQSTGCLKMMNEFFHVSGMKLKGKIVFAGTRNKNKVPSSIVNKINNMIK